MNLNAKNFRLFLTLSRPIFILGGVLLYGLGAAIASFLGKPIDLYLYLLGQGLVTSLQLMTHFLLAYHEPRLEEDDQPVSFSNVRDSIGLTGLPSRATFYIAITFLVLAATQVSILLVGRQVPLVAWLILLFIFLSFFLYSTPPVRLYTSGYGELTMSLVIAGLIPTFCFALQTGELHRLLVMSTTPLVALHFATMIALELPDYASNIKWDRRTLMVRLGWATAMKLHDLAILFAIASFAVAFFNGLPRRVMIGVLIALPLAIAQIWQMDRIRRGYPARYRTLINAALSLFGLTAYLELIGYLMS